MIAAVNKKDYKLFGAFFRENFPFLVMFADKYVHDMDMAADIAQEAFIQLWRFEGEFVSPEKVKGFLYTTARNLALNHIKHNQIVDEHLRLQEKDSVLFFRNQIIEEETYLLLCEAAKNGVQIALCEKIPRVLNTRGILNLCLCSGLKAFRLKPHCFRFSAAPCRDRAPARVLKDAFQNRKANPIRRETCLFQALC